MKQEKSPASPRRQTFLRVLSLLLLIAVITAIIVFALNAILPGFVDTIEQGDQAAIERYIRSFDSFQSVLLAFFLQFFQIISVFFPGGPIQIAIGIVFGTLDGFLICLAGYVLANLFVFFSARRLGNRFDQLFSNGSNTKKFKFITDAKHPGYVVALSCLIPLLPNGLVPYIAARTKITTPQFFVSVLIGCMPTLLMLNAIGNKILMADYGIVALLAALLVAGVALLYLFRNRLFALTERIHTYVEQRRETRRNGK